VGRDYDIHVTRCIDVAAAAGERGSWWCLEPAITVPINPHRRFTRPRYSVSSKQISPKAPFLFEDVNKLSTGRGWGVMSSCWRSGNYQLVHAPQSLNCR
jgi:hypothetical protein